MSMHVRENAIKAKVHAMSHAQAMSQLLLPFVGKRVRRVVMDEREGVVGLEINGYTVWFMSDPEGNGPGFPEVESCL